jgi:hypothetical protein
MNKKAISLNLFKKINILQAFYFDFNKFRKIQLAEIYFQTFINKGLLKWFRVGFLLIKTKRRMQKKQIEELIGALKKGLRYMLKAKKVEITLHNLNARIVGASVLATFLVAKFRMRYSLSKLLALLFSTYYNEMRFRGLFVIAAGRFTRSERATFQKQRRGRIALHNMEYPVDFAFREVRLRFGYFWVENFCYEEKS